MRNLGATLIAAGLLCQPLPALAQGSDAGPELYAEWRARPANAQRVDAFEGELRARGLEGVAPTYQILRSALAWRRCKAEPFALPEARYWEGAFASLEVIESEIVPLVGKVEIVSGYRDPVLNDCAGGKGGSIHLRFGAFDLFAVGDISRAQMIERLCGWHRERGRARKAGLGIYEARKFHVDVGLKGYRRWGPGYRSASSPCDRKRLR